MSLKTIEKAKENLIDLITNLVELTEKEVEKLSTEIEEKESEIEELKEELNNTTPFKYPKGFNANIVVVGALEELFENLNRIPISEIEELVAKYRI